MNPQDVLPLTPRATLDHYQKLAENLVEACKWNELSAIQAWAGRWVRKQATLNASDAHRMAKQIAAFAHDQFSSPRSGKYRCSIKAAQLVVARAYGFSSWPIFRAHVKALQVRDSQTARFERAADAIIAGDISKLRRLIRETPGLAKMRSKREHQAMLLHYVAANGVENYRQKTPQNIVEVAKLLLDADAPVDATAEMYGGGATTLGLAATSAHPERAGVQTQLLQVLLDYGAKIDQPKAGGNKSSAVAGCLANGCGEAAVFLAQRGARLTLATAAGVGMLDRVRAYFPEEGSTKRSPSKKEMTASFLNACGYGRKEVVAFLLDRGVDVSTQDKDGQTGLHWAVIGGHPEIVRVLLAKNAPLEVQNLYGGTVLGQCLWSAAHGGNKKAYLQILELLAAADAKIPERHVPVNKQVDAWLAKRGSRAEHSWHWYGEDPNH
jgi:hypothetical protein